MKKVACALQNTVGKNSISSEAKVIRKIQFEIIDQQLKELVQICRQARKPVTLATLSYRAFKIRENLPAINSDSRMTAELKSFCASKNCCLAFKRHHAMRSQYPRGKADIETVSRMSSEIVELRAKLAQYPLDHIYNMDETGLFFKLLPRRSYVFDFKGRLTVQGIKAVNAKDRITAFVCTNADRSAKVDLSMIGKAKSPCCFRIGKPQVTYFSQKNAWTDNDVFKRWFCNVFVPHIRTETSRSVALFMGSCGPHGSDVGDGKD